MPQGHESQWHINGEIEFLHLYLTDETLKQYPANNFSTDVRFIELRDLIYQEDPVLQALFKQYFSLFDNARLSSPLFAEEAIHKVFHHLIQHYNGFKVNHHQINGGLSVHHMRLIQAKIESEIEHKLSITSLAESIHLSPFHLSPFHFARTVKESFGISPATYLTVLPSRLPSVTILGRITPK